MDEKDEEQTEGTTSTTPATDFVLDGARRSHSSLSKLPLQIGVDETNKMREIIVLPALEILEGEKIRPQDLNAALQEITQFVRAKTKECERIIKESSVVSFTANSIQSRIISTEFGTKLTKLYEVLDVKKMDAFQLKLNEYSKSQTQTANYINELNEAFLEWENFLKEIDKELDKIAGPNTTQALRSTDDIQLISQNKMFKNGTLLSYIKNSSYEMMFLEVVASFSIQECYEHVKKMFDHLTEFHKLNCDILLLTKRPSTDGGGFLKLIGMPFRMLLNENESMKQILAHRQAVISMAGVKAIHIYAEFICNEHSLEISKQDFNGEESNTMYSVFGSQSGCVLIDQKGQIIYSYVCTDNTDWPDVEVLLEQVRLAKRPLLDSKQQENTTTIEEKNKTHEKGDLMANTLTTYSTTNETDPRITVYKKKCCTIL